MNRFYTWEELSALSGVTDYDIDFARRNIDEDGVTYEQLITILNTANEIKDITTTHCCRTLLQAIESHENRYKVPYTSTVYKHKLYHNSYLDELLEHLHKKKKTSNDSGIKHTSLVDKKVLDDQLKEDIINKLQKFIKRVKAAEDIIDVFDSMFMIEELILSLGGIVEEPLTAEDV